MWEIIDLEVKRKIAAFAERPELVVWSGTAERDIAAIAGATRLAVLDAVLDHLASGYAVDADYMKNGDLAYIFRSFVGERRLYIKVKFIFLGTQERMKVFAAHPDR